MLMSLFAIILSLAVVSIFLGYYSKEGLYSFLGCTLLVILGLSTLITGTLQYQSGQTESITYTYTNSTLISSAATTTNAYSSVPALEVRFIGFLFVITGSIGVAITMREVKGIPA